MRIAGHATNPCCSVHPVRPHDRLHPHRHNERTVALHARLGNKSPPTKHSRCADAHDRLAFRTAPHGWNATPTGGATYAAYDQWAAGQVSTEIARAGYRLAAVLKKIWP